jgi:CheY-like chemotaxis protein/HPt (histidine-containing phosphotransfer) domain-containing protein
MPGVRRANWIERAKSLMHFLQLVRQTEEVCTDAGLLPPTIVLIPITPTELGRHQSPAGLIWFLNGTWANFEIDTTLAHLKNSPHVFPRLLIHAHDVFPAALARVLELEFFTRVLPAQKAQTVGKQLIIDPVDTMTPARILVAEDNATNQRVISRFLEKLGFEHVVVENGELAVRAAAEQEYALVLMDCQMPVMDGFEATTRIRRLPGHRGRIPIMAVTANVAPGVAERCHAVGMNAYMSKPLDLSLLQNRIQELLTSVPAAREPQTLQVLPSADIDFAHLNQIQELDGTGEFLREMLEAFLTKLDPLVRDLHERHQNADCDGLEKAAHYLKGSAGNIGARALWSCLASIEQTAHMKDLPALQQAMQNLPALVDAVKRDILRDWLRRDSSAA